MTYSVVRVIRIIRAPILYILHPVPSTQRWPPWIRRWRARPLQPNHRVGGNRHIRHKGSSRLVEVVKFPQWDGNLSREVRIFRVIYITVREGTQGVWGGSYDIVARACTSSARCSHPVMACVSQERHVLILSGRWSAFFYERGEVYLFCWFHVFKRQPLRENHNISITYQAIKNLT